MRLIIGLTKLKLLVFLPQTGLLYAFNFIKSCSTVQDSHDNLLRSKLVLHLSFGNNCRSVQASLHCLKLHLMKAL